MVVTPSVAIATATVTETAVVPVGPKCNVRYQHFFNTSSSYQDTVNCVTNNPKRPPPYANESLRKPTQPRFRKRNGMKNAPDWWWPSSSDWGGSEQTKPEKPIKTGELDWEKTRLEGRATREAPNRMAYAIAEWKWKRTHPPCCRQSTMEPPTALRATRRPRIEATRWPLIIKQVHTNYAASPTHFPLRCLLRSH